MAGKLGKIIYYASCVILNRILSILPLHRGRVLFLSDVREDLSGNFGMVSRALEADPDPSHHWEIVTSLKGDRRIRRSFGAWLRQCYDIATSEYICLDDYTTSTALIRVRKGQELVQLWHSSGIFKKFAHSRGGANGDIRHIHPGYKRYTKTICSSEACRPFFAEAFAIPEERVLATGIPRTDIFYDAAYIEQKREAFFAAHPALRGRKIILFAPTYRGTKVEEADYDFGRFDPDAAYRALGDGYAILFKWHPALYNNIRFGKARAYDLSKYPGFAYDVSDQREVNDLLFVTDILVTDYSSIIFDYALLGKPIVCFAYDLEDYEAGRGLYLPFSEYLYGPVARNTGELIEAIRSEDLDETRRAAFVRKFAAANDGHATERVMRDIFGVQDPVETAVRIL